MEAQGWPKPFRGHSNVAEMWQFCFPLVETLWPCICFETKNIHIISWHCAAHDLICPTEWRLKLETCCTSLWDKKNDPLFTFQTSRMHPWHWPLTQQAHVHVWDWTDAWNVQTEWTFDVNFLFFTVSHNHPPPFPLLQHSHLYLSDSFLR